MKAKEGKRPVNIYEALCWETMKKDGWTVTKRGWPDLACFKGNEFVAIEVKRKRSHHLKYDQYMIMEILSRYGMKCYMWTEDGGFQLVTPTERHLTTRQEAKNN